MTRLVLLLAVLASARAAAEAPDLLEPLARGDAAWARRAEGFDRTGRPSLENVEAALHAYESALHAAPSNVAVRLRVTEARWFRAWFLEPDPRKRRKAFEALATFAEETVSIAEARVPGAGRLEPLQRGRALEGDPDAAGAHFWAAISWGLWGMSHSKLSSGFHGVASKIRDHALVLEAIDPEHADAGARRLLGRLHAKTPRIKPFTGWIDPAAGIALLRSARAASDADPRNAFFLAEALLDHAPDRRAEAVALLREVAARAPDEAQLVEQSETIEQARALLATLPEGAP